MSDLPDEGGVMAIPASELRDLRSVLRAFYDVRCDLHGRMMYDAPCDLWTCPGFDGEGCRVMVKAETITGGAASGPCDRWPGEMDPAPGAWRLAGPVSFTAGPHQYDDDSQTVPITPFNTAEGMIE